MFFMSKFLSPYSLNPAPASVGLILLKGKTSENRMQSQTGLNYAKVHPVLRSAKNPAP